MYLSSFIWKTQWSFRNVTSLLLKLTPRLCTGDRTKWSIFIKRGHFSSGRGALFPLTNLVSFFCQSDGVRSPQGTALKTAERTGGGNCKKQAP